MSHDPAKIQVPLPEKSTDRRIRPKGPNNLAITREELAEYRKLDSDGKRSWTVRKKLELGKPHARQVTPLKEKAEKKSLDEERRRMNRELSLHEMRTAKEMQGEMSRLMKKYQYNPVEKLFQVLTSGKLPIKEQMILNKFLVPYVTPTLKAIDVQQETKMNVSFTIQSFRGASQEDLKPAAKLYGDDEYEEFLLENDEEDGLLEKALE